MKAGGPGDVSMAIVSCVCACATLALGARGSPSAPAAPSREECSTTWWMRSGADVDVAWHRLRPEVDLLDRVAGRGRSRD